jgi:hypothetical protein
MQPVFRLFLSLLPLIAMATLVLALMLDAEADEMSKRLSSKLYRRVLQMVILSFIFEAREERTTFWILLFMFTVTSSQFLEIIQFIMRFVGLWGV